MTPGIQTQVKGAQFKFRKRKILFAQVKFLASLLILNEVHWLV